MIEVEKKFQPTEEQLQNLLKGCVFVKEIVNHDIVYDYPDYKLIRKGVRLRKRNGNFELKISEDGKDESISLEIDKEEEIKKYLNTDLPISEFIAKNMIEAMDIKTSRRKFKKDNFIIDVDELDFGYKCVEIEILVENRSEVPEAYQRILNLAQVYNFDLKEVSPKKKEYFRKVKPDVYNMLYGQG